MSNLIRINPNDLSKVFWDKILTNSNTKKEIMGKDFYNKIDQLDKLRHQINQPVTNTGSVTLTTSWLLFSLTLFFKPRSIVEIGSFIGKSVFGMAIASDLYLEEYPTQIYCCDYSNKIDFPNITSNKIQQFHMTSSTDMLSKIDNNVKIDLLHIDGRLEEQDYGLLKNKISNECIIILDDFEGIEKGVVNLINIFQKNLVSRKTHFLVYPIQDETKIKHDLYEKSTSAILLPVSKVIFTPQ